MAVTEWNSYSTVHESTAAAGSNVDESQKHNGEGMK